MVLPTGAGKSIVIADIAHRLNDYVLVFVHHEIVEQNFKSYVHTVCLTAPSIQPLSTQRDKPDNLATIGSVKGHPRTICTLQERDNR